LSDNRDYRDNHDYHLYKIDHDNPWSFDEMHFAKHFAKQVGRFACLAFQRGQRAVEGTEGHRRDRGPWRGQRAVEGTEGRRRNIGP
jgi:hypothetical protein